MDDDDAALAQRFVDGDATAFATLYDRYAPTVHQAACGLLGAGDSANSVVVTVFHRLSRDLRRSGRHRARPLRRLHRLTRAEVRRRFHLFSGWRPMPSDGSDRSLSPELRAHVLQLSTTSAWRPPTRPWIDRIGLVGVGIVLIAAAVFAAPRIGRSISDAYHNLRNDDATDTTAVAEAVTTSSVAIAPPVPETTAPPAPAAASGPVIPSASALDFTGRTDAGIELTNTAPDLQLWNVDGDLGPFRLTSTPGVINPGETVTVGFAFDPTGLGEGDYDAAATVQGAVPFTLALHASIEHAPEVAVVSVTPATLSACDGGAMQVQISVNDESGIGSAQLAWVGPGSPGAAPISPSGWLGTITPEVVAGQWAFVAKVIDARGNVSTATGTFEITPCA